MTNLIICHYHESVYHQGRGITQNEINQMVAGLSVVALLSPITYSTLYPVEG